MRFWVWLGVFMLLGGSAAAQEQTFSGIFHVDWGDGNPVEGVFAESVTRYQLALDDGGELELLVAPGFIEAWGGIMGLNGREAVVTGWLEGDGPGGPFEVTSIWCRREDGESRAVTGSQPWISLLMKFSDVGDEPKNLAFFQNMYANVPGALDHYWREVSYDNIDVLGSTAINWLTLPHTHATYVPTPGSGTGADLNALFIDATNTADPFVDFSNGGTGGYQGINLMFNAVLDCCAWGGTRFATLDGVTKIWRVTWEPPWGYADEGVIAHEMGHGFGLPHSNNTDLDSSPYDNPWDVMSAATGHCVTDPTYGRLGKHTCAYHKDILGWFAPSEKLVLNTDGEYQVTIEHMALSSTSAYFMVKIPIAGSASHFYTLEVRKREGNYDGNLPGNAVIIYEVQTGRSEPAWILDADDPPATYSNTEGCMWKVGETFEDAANEILVTVDAATTNGFDLTIRLGQCDPMTQLYAAIELWPNPNNLLDLLDAMSCP